MIDKDILDGLSELDDADLKRIKLLVDNKLKIESSNGSPKFVNDFCNFSYGSAE